MVIKATATSQKAGICRSDTRSDLCIIHLNARSIKNKIDLIEAEANQFDIITVSETWLSQIDMNTSVHLTNFHPPIRRDRPNDPHGGVAIYVKNNLFCKPRPDLQVNGLEAVWVETKINQESLLVGSFYRPPNSSVNYWELISDSIRWAVMLPYHYTPGFAEQSTAIFFRSLLSHPASIECVCVRYTCSKDICVNGVW